jgi:glucokinase
MPIAAIDLGGTKVAGAVFNSTGEITHREVRPLSGATGPEVGALILDLVHTFSQQSRVDAIGVAVPGIYHNDTGTVWAPNIAGWDDYPLLKELRMASHIPVAIESDRTCYILGETWHGHARGMNDAVFVAVGTGIGAGIMLAGRVLRGSQDVAGAIGWLSLSNDFHSEYQACGDFEFHASGPGIARAAGCANAEAAFEAYARGEPVATQAIKTAVAYWGRAVANLVSLLNPQMIVFGGGVFGPGAALLDDIYAEALKWAQPISIRQVKLVASALGNDAGLYGAGAVGLEIANRKVALQS